MLPRSRPYAQLLPIRNYTTRQGLNTNSINAILRDSRGMLWVGTYNGPNLYDGARFLQPAMTTRSGQIYVTCLMEDTHRQVWIATWYSGLYKYKDGVFTNYLPDSIDISSQANNFTAIIQLDDSTFLAGTDKNALLFDGQKFTPLDPANTLLDQQIHSIVRTPAGDILIGLPQGLAWYRKTDARWKYAGLLLSGTDVNNMAAAGEHVWLTTNRNLLYYPAIDSALAQAADPLTLVSGPVDNVFPVPGPQTAGGDCWYTEPIRGAWRLHDGKPVQRLTRDNGLPSSFIKAICADTEGIIWLGTEYGLSKLTPAAYQFYPVTEDSLRDANIIASAKDRNSTLWLGTFSGIYRMQDGRATQVLQPGGLPFGYVFTLIRDKHDRLWACTASGLFCREAGTFQKRYAGIVTGGTVDSAGVLWFGTLDGHILRFDDRPLHDPAEKNSSHGRGAGAAIRDLGVQNNLRERITALHAGAEDVLWVGYYRSGLYKFSVSDDSLEQIKAYNNTNGYGNLQVRSIAALPDGQLLVGTRTSGLFFFDPVRPPISREQGLSGPWIKDLYTGRGDIYLATNNGLDRLDTGVLTPVHHISFNQELIPTELNNLLYYSDTFWLGTSRGVLVYTPEKQTRDSLPPPVYGMRVVINGHVDSSFLPFTGSDSIPVLDYTQNNLSFDFAALTFRDEDNVRYRYKLEGVDQAWSTPTDRRYVNYGNLPPGSYRFLVAAANGYGVWSTRAAAISFTIAAPFWRTTWFLLICTIAAIAAVYGIYQFRLHQILQVEKLRTRISTDLHDDIGSTLSSISILSDMAIQEEEVRNGPFALPGDGPTPDQTPTTGDQAATPDQTPTAPENSAATDQTAPENTAAPAAAHPTTLWLMIREIRDNSLSLLEKMDDIVWSINPRNDTLESLLLRVHRFGAQLFEARSIEYEIEIEPGVRHLRLNMERRQSLYLITKEAIINLVKYAYAGKAHIRARAVRHCLEVRISDNGRGFDQKIVRPGNGIINMKNRAASMKAGLTIDSIPGRGTTVTLTLKI